MTPSRSRRGLALGAALVALWAAAPAAAQPREPIYLQYDGFVRNKDGGYTLAFGYFNTNHVDVSLEPGPDNGFLPGPADRGQPATFLRGRHRFVCTVVVGPDFDGKFQWQVRFANVTSTTTAKMLEPLYELERNSLRRVTTGLDATKAPHNVCVNRPPAVVVINPQGDFNAGAEGMEATAFTIRQDQELNLLGEAEDDGLPRGSKVTVAWKKNAGPGTVTFSDAATATTRARFGATGVYELELSATDGQVANSVKVKVTVNPPGAPAAEGKEQPQPQP